MKKTGVLILALILCLALCACGKSEAVIQTETLITVVGAVTLDSEPAIAAAEAAYAALPEKEKEQVENYAVLTEARSAFDTMLAEELEKRSVYYGEWKNVIYGNSMTLKEDNHGTVWTRTEQGVRIGNKEYVFEDHSDFVRLVSAGEHGRNILVPTKYLTATEVELTAENWTVYFQPLREAAFLVTDPVDNIVKYEIWLLAAFRDEVVDRFDRTADRKHTIHAEVVGMNYFGNITVDEETKEFTVLGGLRAGWDYTSMTDFHQSDFAEYMHHGIAGAEDADIPQGWHPVGCILSARVSEETPGKWELETYVPEYTISVMEGTILLYDLPVCQ